VVELVPKGGVMPISALLVGTLAAKHPIEKYKIHTMFTFKMRFCNIILYLIDHEMNFPDQKFMLLS
jgi:hypothetical protein